MLVHILSFRLSRMLSNHCLNEWSLGLINFPLASLGKNLECQFVENTMLKCCAKTLHKLSWGPCCCWTFRKAVSCALWATTNKGFVAEFWSHGSIDINACLASTEYTS